MNGQLVPARFLTLVGHLCVITTLLWESEQSVRHCLPTEFHQEHLTSFQRKLVGGYGASIALIGFELITFLTGLTMFSPTTALISTGCHGTASIVLAYFILDAWHCEWFWFIFTFCSVLPFLVDIITNNENKLEDSPKKPSNQWTYIIILAGISTTLGSSLPVGYNIGVINTPAEIIKQFCNESFISRYDVALSKSSLNLLWSSIVSIFIIGGVTGSCLGAIVADNIGRKGGVILTNVLSSIGAIAFVCSLPVNSVELLILGRLLVGLSAGLTTSIVPMYLMELAPVLLRGPMGVMCPLGVTSGVLFGQIMSLDVVLGKENSWHYLLAFYAILVVMFTPILFILPESPKYLLVVRSQYAAAIKALCRIQNKSAVQLSNEIIELQNEKNDDNEDHDSWGLGRVICSPNLRLGLLLVCCMQAGQQTSGINAVFYYSNSIFLKAKLTPWAAQLGTLGAGVINLSMAILAIPIMAHCGRRLLIIISTAFSTFCLVVLCITISLIDLNDFMPILCIAAVSLYVLFYGLGLGPIPYFVASELFEVGPRPAAMALGSLCNWGGNFIVGITFPSLQESIDAYSFLLFATSTGLLCIFIYFRLPETKGKTPSEITSLLQNRSRNAFSS